MSESTAAVLLIILVLFLLLVVAFFGSRFLMRRAIKAVIKAFRQNNAVNALTAMTREELGLKPRGLFEFRGLRDYKPMALQLLIQNEIVQVTEDGRLFLSEGTLSQTTLEQNKS